MLASVRKRCVRAMVLGPRDAEASRCDQSVAETTYAMFGEPERPRVAPSELMVNFYGLQKRAADAVKFAETMGDIALPSLGRAMCP